GLTGSASGGMTIALDALGGTYLRLAVERGIDPALMHRVATLSAGTLDALPHNGTVLTVLHLTMSRNRGARRPLAVSTVERARRRSRRGSRGGARGTSRGAS